jgi:hypothetical protein
MMATVPQVTSGLGLRKFQADGFLLTRVYNRPISGHITMGLGLGLPQDLNTLLW